MAPDIKYKNYYMNWCSFNSICVGNTMLSSAFLMFLRVCVASVFLGLGGIVAWNLFSKQKCMLHNSSTSDANIFKGHQYPMS